MNCELFLFRFSIFANKIKHMQPSEFSSIFRHAIHPSIIDMNMIGRLTCLGQAAVIDYSQSYQSDFWLMTLFIFQNNYSRSLSWCSKSFPNPSLKPALVCLYLQEVRARVKQGLIGRSSSRGIGSYRVPGPPPRGIALHRPRASQRRWNFVALWRSSRALYAKS